jgi:ABC-type sulfate transport system substrate-binding protein
MAIWGLYADRNREQCNKHQNRNNKTPSEYSVQQSHTSISQQKLSILFGVMLAVMYC